MPVEEINLTGKSVKDMYGSFMGKIIGTITGIDGSIDTVNHQMKNLFETLEKKHQFNYKRIDVPLDKRKFSKNNKMEICLMRSSANL